MTIDDFTQNPWTAQSYGPITGSGSAKMAASRVAPLVALARGYFTVADSEAAKKFASMSRALTSTVKLTRDLQRLVTADEDDLLAMPWHSAASVKQDGTASRAQSFQYRPSTPVTMGDGKTAKYVFFSGAMHIDLHPATPVEWLDDAPQVLVTEGLLKGDSALTAMLLASGRVSVEQLSTITNERGQFLSVEDARLRLQEHMLAVPKSARAVIASSASVTTWQGKDADWRAVNLRGKRVIVAFDGDLADNANVYRETTKFFREVEHLKGTPVLLTLFSAEVETAKISAGLDPSEKLGIDDYLASIGDWHSLLTLTSPDLPPAPRVEGANARVGDWRVHPDNDAVVQEYVQVMNPDGSRGGAQWENRAQIGGRIVSHIESRRPTPTEVEDGVIDRSQPTLLEDSTCEIEIALLDRNQDIDDEPQRFRVFGPASLMSVPPQDWARHAHRLPNEVLAHPDWPPRKGYEWLSAVKANRRDETDGSIAWGTMGWVPGQTTPSFLIGNQTISATEHDEMEIRRGVDERALPGASKFGVVDEWDYSFNQAGNEKLLKAYKKQVLKDIRDVCRVFVDNGFWRDRATAVAVLCAMFRPSIPMHPGTTLYFVGPKGAGKSYTASFPLKAWQARPGTWTDKSLPGSAGDTFAAHESSVALAPIWCIDDLAPQSDRQRAQQQLSDLESIIRGMHNQSAKRRLDGRTMGQREVPKPIAMLSITAENPPLIPSILDRILMFNVPKGAFNDDGDENHPHQWRQHELIEMCDRGDVSVPARLAAAMIRFWLHDDTRLGSTWQERQRSLRKLYDGDQARALHVLKKRGMHPGSAKRFVDQIASIGLTLNILGELAIWAGAKEDDPLVNKLQGEDGYVADLYDVAAKGIIRSRANTPGVSLLRALANLMAAGRAHLRNPTTNGAPPFVVRDGAEDVGGVDVSALNHALGWEFDARQSTWVPKGDCIGVFGEREGTKIALFDMTNAFKRAQREYPELIPYGQTAAQSWASVHNEDLTAVVGSGRHTATTTRVALGEAGSEKPGGVRLSGVPVLAEQLFKAAEDN